MSDLEDYLDRVLAGRIGLSINETARILGRSTRRVYVLLDEGELQSYPEGASRLILAPSIRAHVLRRVAAGEAKNGASPISGDNPSEAPRRGRGRPPKRKLVPAKAKPKDETAEHLDSAAEQQEIQP